MRRRLVTALAIFALISFPVYAQMTDAAIVEYLKSGIEAGKTESQLAQELVSRGVSVTQLRRLRSTYEASKTGSFSDQSSVSAASSQLRQNGVKTGVRKTKKDKTALTPQIMGGSSMSMTDMPAFASDSLNRQSRPDSLKASRPGLAQKKIFGHDIFSAKGLSFEPNENVATPSDYKLGPGDDIIIDIWGYNEASIKQTISPEGRIIVSQIGPVYLNGLTIQEAQTKIRRAFAKKYASVAGENPQSEISVTLGDVRTIQVNVLGEVNRPGTFRLSSFSTVFHALYRAGGVTPVGTLRNVSVKRSGKEIASVDIYDLIFNGEAHSDLHLQDGDVILVPAYSCLASVKGKARRPMYYELKAGETVGDLINYAGGFAGDAYRTEVSIMRQTGLERKILTVKEANFASVAIEDGDELSIGSSLKRISNVVEVKGAVRRPGQYELGGDIATVRQLVEHANGLTEEAFTSRAQIVRRRDDLSRETIAVDLKGILNGTADDVALRRYDVLFISNIHEMYDKGTLTINGFVAFPGTYEFSENTTVEDLIMIAGGLLDGASTAKVDVARRVNDPSSLNATDTLSKVFTFALKDGFVVDGSSSFVLAPYDVVSVRKSPGYSEQRLVTVTGEVAFPGEYTLTNNKERLSEVVARAGGVTPSSYPKGGILKRKMTAEELQLRENTLKMIKNGNTKDTLKLAKSDLMEDSYSVAVSVDLALKNPGSDYDLVLKEGDEIVIPEYLSTVKIEGDVMCPNTVLFMTDKPLRYYINAAGGYGEFAKRSKVYIVYMNGRVERGRRNVKIEPGCEIIVPSKPERKGMTTGEVLSIGTSTASVATMIATIVNLLK